jgi:hemin uptake protein HemP
MTTFDVIVRDGAKKDLFNEPVEASQHEEAINKAITTISKNSLAKPEHGIVSEHDQSGERRHDVYLIKYDGYGAPFPSHIFSTRFRAG